MYIPITKFAKNAIQRASTGFAKSRQCFSLFGYGMLYIPLSKKNTG